MRCQSGTPSSWTEADLPTCLWFRPFEGAEGLEDVHEYSPVNVDLSLNLVDSMAKFGRLSQAAPQLNEGAHDQDVHRDGTFTSKHTRQHRDTLLRERVRRLATAAMAART